MKASFSSRWVIAKQDVSFCFEVDQDQRLPRTNALPVTAPFPFHFLTLSFHPSHQMFVDNGFVSDPISFSNRAPKPQSPSTSPHIETSGKYPSLTGSSPSCQRRQTSKVIPGSILSFCRKLKKPEKLRYTTAINQRCSFYPTHE
jgi:hypothetical protein